LVLLGLLHLLDPLLDVEHRRLLARRRFLTLHRYAHVRRNYLSWLDDLHLFVVFVLHALGTPNDFREALMVNEAGLHELAMLVDVASLDRVELRLRLF